MLELMAVLLPIHRLPRPDAVTLAYGVVRVGHEGVGQAVLHLELRVLLGRVRAYTDDHRIDSLEPREGVLEAARLDGSARGVVLGIEKQYDDVSA